MTFSELNPKPQAFAIDLLLCLENCSWCFRDFGKEIRGKKSATIFAVFLFSLCLCQRS